MRFISTLFSIAFLCAMITSCGDSHSPLNVGDSCSPTDECPGKCQVGGGFPGGICTLECDLSSECPEGWSCVTKSSGICLKNCDSTASCQSEFGEEWVCDDEDLQDPGVGDRQVCIGQ